MRLTACVLYEDGDDLISWRQSLPYDNMQIIALKTVHDTTISEPEFELVGKSGELVALEWRYPDFAECFDFAYLRNKLDDFAEGDWILHMDSDERLASPHDELWTYLDTLEKQGASAAYVSIAGCTHHLAKDSETYRERYCEPNMRLHKRTAYLRWEGICHEVLDIPLSNIVIADTDILLYHKGYTYGLETMLSKTKRNAELLIREYIRQKSERNWNYLISTFSYINQNSR